MRILVLDDNPSRHDAFALICADAERVHVRSAREACEALTGEQFDLVTLDHDLNDWPELGESEGDGADVARHIARMAPWRRPGVVVVHSVNPEGARAMGAILRWAGVVAILQPWGDIPDEQQGPVEFVEGPTSEQEGSAGAGLPGGGVGGVQQSPKTGK